MGDRRIENLERLAILRADGVLTQGEFEREKRRILGDDADPQPAPHAAAPWDTAPARPRRRPLVAQLGWLVLGLATLGAAAWLTFASPAPNTAAIGVAPLDPVTETVPPLIRPNGANAAPTTSTTGAVGVLDGLTPAALAGGWAAEATACNLGDKDPFDYFEADGRYGGWGGFGGYTAEGRWALTGTSLVETITDRTQDNEARNPQKLASAEVRTFEVLQWATDKLSLKDQRGTITRLIHCPDAHFEFTAKG